MTGQQAEQARCNCSVGWGYRKAHGPDPARCPVHGDCKCPPCPGRGNDGHRMTHCAECCFGTGVEADPACPVHGYMPVMSPGKRGCEA